MQLTDLPKFLSDVKAETARITWPTWAATRQMGLMVLILVTLVSLYLLGVDMLIGWGVSTLLGM